MVFHKTNTVHCQSFFFVACRPFTHMLWFPVSRFYEISVCANVCVSEDIHAS